VDNPSPTLHATAANVAIQAAEEAIKQFREAHPHPRFERKQ
jgi:hypothetical protein